MSDWPQHRMKYIVGINERSLSEDVSPDFRFRYVDIGAVGRGTLVAALPAMTFREAPSRARRLVASGDTIVSTVRTYLRAVWPVVGDPEDLVVSTGFAVLTPSPVIDARFLSWWAQSDPFVEEIVARSAGVSYPSINASDLGDLRMPVPTLAAQRMISDYLDSETARIDALIAQKQRLAQLLAERWRAAVAIRMRRLAESHGTIQLRHLVRCLDGRRIPLSGEERSSRRGEYPYYGASGIVDHIDDFIFDETLVLLGEDGAQLGDPNFSISSVVEGRFWVNNHAHVLRPTRADPGFLALHLNTFDRVPFMSGGTREKITQDDMNRIPVPQISFDRQRKEAEALIAIRHRCEVAADLVSSQIGLLVEHRQALVTAAVTGELEIPGVAA